MSSAIAYPADVHAAQLRPGDELRVLQLESPRSYELQAGRMTAKGWVCVQVLYRGRSGVLVTTRARRQGWRGNGRPPATLPAWPEVGQVEPGEGETDPR